VLFAREVGTLSLSQKLIDVQTNIDHESKSIENTSGFTSGAIIHEKSTKSDISQLLF